MTGDKRILRLADMGIKLAATKQKFNEVMSETIKELIKDIEDYEYAQDDSIIEDGDKLMSAKWRLKSMQESVIALNDYYNMKTNQITKMLQKLDEEKETPKKVVAKYVGVLYDGVGILAHTQRLSSHEEAITEISEKLLQQNPKGSPRINVRVKQIYVVE